MNIDYLRTFCAIVEEGSFSNAARRLNLTQPSVSLQIKALEEHLGARLFDRSAKPIDLTPQGKSIYPYLRQAVEAYSTAQEKLNERAAAPRCLRIATGYSLGERLLPPLLSRFQGEHPRRTVSLFVCNHRERIQKVLNQDVDASITTLVTGFDPPSIASIPLFEETLQLAVYPQHPWAKRKKIHLEELHDQELIVREPESATRQLLEGLFQQHGVHPRVFMEMASNEAIKASIRSGLGIGFLSALTLEPEQSLGEVVTIHVEGIEPKRTLGYAYLKDRKLSETNRLFLRFLQNLLPTHMPPKEDSTGSTSPLTKPNKDSLDFVLS